MQKVVRAGDAEGDPDRAQRHRQARAEPGSEERVDAATAARGRRSNEPWREVARRGSVAVEVVVVEDVQSDRERGPQY